MPRMCRASSPSLEQIDSTLEQASRLQSAHRENLQKINSDYKRKRSTIDDEIKMLQQKRQQVDGEEQKTVEREVQSYKNKMKQYLKVPRVKFISYLPNQQQASPTNTAEARSTLDGDSNTQDSIHVVPSDSEAEPPISQTVTGQQSSTSHQDGLGASKQPELRNKRRPLPTRAGHAENDDAPQFKKARHGDPPDTSTGVTSRVHARTIPHNDQSIPSQTTEVSSSASVHLQPEDFQGITDPLAGEIYKIEDRRTKDGHPAVVLPLGDFIEIGISRSIHDTDLKKVPPCYRYDARNRKILGWHKDFEDDGPNIFDRKFPCMFFRGNSRIPLVGEYCPIEERFRWMSARVLRPFNPPAVTSQDNSGWTRACMFSKRLELIRKNRARGNRHAGATAQMPVAERDEEDGQIGKNAPNIPPTDKSPRASSVNNMLRPSWQALDPSSSQSPCRGQAEHSGNTPDERRESRPQTSEETNQQRPVPTPKEHDYVSNGQSQIRPRDALGRFKSIEEAASADWGNVATFMEITDGLEAVTPRPDTNRDDQTPRADQNITPPVIPLQQPEGAMISAPGGRDEVGDQANTSQITSPCLAEIPVGQEHNAKARDSFSIDSNCLRGLTHPPSPTRSHNSCSPSQ